MEDILIKSRVFSLPGKKAFDNPDEHFEVVMIDATETPIERPKKTKKILFWKKEKTYDKNTSCGW